MDSSLHFEVESIKRDAASSEGRSFEERIAMFVGLMATIEAIRANLTPEERARRRRIANCIDPRPEPWWRNVRKEALAEYQCQDSATDDRVH